MDTINLSAIVGEKASILAEARDRLALTANVNVETFKNEVVNVIRDRAFKYLHDMIAPAVNAAYIEVCMSNGEPEPTWIFARRELWGDIMDDKLGVIIEPYDHMLTADWIGRFTIGSRLYEVDGVENWIKEFAAEIYRNITYLHKQGEEGAPKTAGQIASSVGIVAEDFEQYVRTRQPPTQQQIEEQRMSTLHETINKLHQWHAMMGAPLMEVRALLENATDSDDGLAMSGIGPLGGDASDVATLRQAKLTTSLNDLAVMIINGMPSAPPAPPPQAGAQPIPAQPMDDLSQFMGGAPVPVEQPYAPMEVTQPATAYVQPPVAPMPTPAPTMEVVPPKPTRKKGGDAPAGALNTRIFAIMKDHTGIKSEDLGASLGVSRGTFDNYAKGKAHCVPTAEGLNYLRNTLVEKINLLNEAYSLLPK